MPIHLKNLDVTSKVEGLSSVLITSCNMCAGASLAMKENKPFLQFFKSLLKSPPLEKYIAKLQLELNGKGIKTKWFRGGIIQQFFLCLWTKKQREKFRKCAKDYEAVVVLGCESAIETVQGAVEGTGCDVIRGVEVVGIMNANPKLHLPFDISFQECKVVSMCRRSKNCPYAMRE